MDTTSDAPEANGALSAEGTPSAATNGQADSASRKRKRSETQDDVVPEALDLSEFESADQLKPLGLNRLKAALLFLGAKCGGTLDERAERLFSLKVKDEERNKEERRTKGRKRNQGAAGTNRRDHFMLLIFLFFCSQGKKKVPKHLRAHPPAKK